MCTVWAQGGLAPQSAMAPVPHRECGVLLTSDSQQNPIVVNPISGEAKPVKAGAQLLFDSSGWGYVACPGDGRAWLKTIFEISVQKDPHGQLYLHNRTTSCTTWHASLAKQGAQLYPVALLGGKEWVLSVHRLQLPREAQRCYWDLRLIQELHPKYLCI